MPAAIVVGSISAEGRQAAQNRTTNGCNSRALPQDTIEVENSVLPIMAGWHWRA